MQKNSGQFSMEDAARFANSEAGKKLLAMLQQSGGDAVKKAMQELSSGNVEQARLALKDLAGSEDVQKLLRQSGG